MISFSECQSKFPQNSDDEALDHPPTAVKSVKSEFYQLYQDLAEPIKGDQEKIIQAFNRNGISYNPSMPYEALHFDLQKVVPCFGFYRAHVKIGHFKLTVTLAKYDFSNILQCQQAFSGSFGKICFTRLEGKWLCLKGFPYENINEFQSKLILAIKEWAILKICSVLECSTYMKNYLGFDIIVFNDCIQFATERGTPITELTQHQESHLKSQLRLMHEFKIIHYDIKPDNIIFSEHFQKPVFIDFGLSEIVNQQCGFKTFSSFRGTPVYCTIEMLEIMLETQGLVDLYYNDLYGLKMVLNEIKNKIQRNFPNVQPDEVEISFYQNIGVILEEKNISNSIHNLFVFQFHYLNSNILKSKQALKSYLNEGGSIHKVLRFIQKMVGYVFLSEIFYEYVKPCESAVGQQIKEKIKLNGEKLFFIAKSKEEPLTEDEKIDHTIEFDVSSLLRNDLLHNYQNYAKIIISICKFEKQTISNFIAIIYQCLRFDTKNLKFQEKVFIAQGINPLLSDYLGGEHESIEKDNDPNRTEQGNDMNKIKYLFILIFTFCVNSRLNKWIKNHLFDVFQQLILLDINSSHLADQLLQYLQKNQVSFENPLVIFQLTRLIQALRMIVTQHIESIPFLVSKFDSYILACTLKFQKEAESSMDIQVKSIFKLLKMFREKKILGSENLFIEQEQCLKLVKNPTIRKQLVYHLINKKFNTAFDTNKLKDIMKLIEDTKRSMDIYNLDLLSCIRLNQKLMNFTSSFSALCSYYNYVESVINCPYVYNLINLQNESSLALQGASLNFKMKFFLKTYPTLCKLDVKADYKLLEIFWHVDLKDAIEKPMREQFIRIYQMYQRHLNVKMHLEKEECQYYYITFWRIHIEYRYYIFDSSTQAVFLNNLAKSEQELQKATSSFQIVISNFKVSLYRYYLSLTLKHYQSCISYLKEVFNIAKTLKLDLILLEVLKFTNQVSWKWGIEEIILESACSLYDFCKSQSFFSFYLIPAHYQYCYITFVVFARENKPSMHELLLHLSQFVTEYPIDSHFLAFTTAIDAFLKNDLASSRQIHYRQFAEFNLRINPYLLVFYIYSLHNESPDSKMKIFRTFAKNCNQLTQFAKRKLLERYFSVFLRFLNERNLRKSLFVFREAKYYITLKEIKMQIKVMLNFLKQPYSRESVFKHFLKLKIASIKM